MFIRIYNILIRILYPLVIKRYINKRKQNGKEDLKRFNERMGRPQLKRPDGKLIWLHGASVGESLSMLPLINRLLDLYPEAHVMVTTGTITSAELMGKKAAGKGLSSIYSDRQSGFYHALHPPLAAGSGSVV